MELQVRLFLCARLIALEQALEVEVTVNEMKRTRHLIWIFPLLVVAAAALLYQAGASRLSVLALKKELARQYGVSEGTIEEMARRLPPGWQFGDPERVVLITLVRKG